ncbi:hypothetical protein CTAYLR_001182 [Chrysophaeum taylorii]|uniref:Mitochondrial import inner membrane translocase subunit TIM50 n=1 Tax=Chrysophaeum taylorii TaxID=2483200 RepID=A0AAD7UQN3_9STRA|nr:hypothetical protein CTAYLR_001182 [Chrysophaeum taylorii]
MLNCWCVREEEERGQSRRRQVALVLDIDGTMLSLGCDQPYAMGAMLRPHLDAFLDFCFAECIAVGIWTAASRGWARAFLEAVGPRPWAFVYSSERCSVDGYSLRTLKKLKKVWGNRRLRELGYTRDSTLIIDDAPEACRVNAGNAIYIPSYFGGEDDCLVKIARYIAALSATATPLSFLSRAISSRERRRPPQLPEAALPAIFSYLGRRHLQLPCVNTTWEYQFALALGRLADYYDDPPSPQKFFVSAPSYYPPCHHHHHHHHKDRRLLVYFDGDDHDDIFFSGG